MAARARFELTTNPLPKDAKGKTFFDKSDGYARLRRAFQDLVEERGLGVLIADAGVPKTTAIRNLCAELPQPDFRVLYLCDTGVSPMDIYRVMALELGVQPSHRRGHLWADIKKALVHMVDERGTSPLIILDEAQHLSDAFLRDLASFLNFTFDSRELLTLWLVGLPPLVKKLQMRQHDALRTRIAALVHLEPLDRTTFGAAVEHAFKAAGAQKKLLADDAMEMLFRASHGVLRSASKTLRCALRIADDRGQAFLDETVVRAAIDELGAGL
jgi:MSHA biogenesis protein MshM